MASPRTKPVYTTVPLPRKNPIPRYVTSSPSVSSVPVALDSTGQPSFPSDWVAPPDPKPHPSYNEPAPYVALITPLIYHNRCKTPKVSPWAKNTSLNIVLQCVKEPGHSGGHSFENPDNEKGIKKHG